MATESGLQRVLVVESDPGYRIDLCRVLSDQGHVVASVAGGDDALALLDHFAPTVVVCELAATASGMTLVRTIRDHAASRDVPILVLGDADHAAAMEQLFELGQVRYLRRGADPETFQRTFATLLEWAEVGLGA